MWIYAHVEDMYRYGCILYIRVVIFETNKKSRAQQYQHMKKVFVYVYVRRFCLTESVRADENSIDEMVWVSKSKGGRGKEKEKLEMCGSYVQLACAFLLFVAFLLLLLFYIHTHTHTHTKKQDTEKG